MSESRVQISGRIDVVTDPMTGSRAEFIKWPAARAKMLAEYDRLQAGGAPQDAEPT